jgi:hypothetical protein
MTQSQPEGGWVFVGWFGFCAGFGEAYSNIQSVEFFYFAEYIKIIL